MYLKAIVMSILLKLGRTDFLSSRGSNLKDVKYKFDLSYANGENENFVKKYIIVIFQILI